MEEIIGTELKSLKNSDIIRLKRISKKYNIKFNQKNIPELCFISVLSDLLKIAMRKTPRIFNSLKSKKELVIVDIGCGYFRYGQALNEVFSEINKNVRIFAVDKDKHMLSYDPAIFIKEDINNISRDLKKHGISRIDFL